MSGAETCQLDGELRNLMADRGLACLENLDESQSLKGRVFHLRGQLLREKQDYSSAVSWLQRATDIDASNLDIYLGLGWYYKRLGRIDLAIESLERAVDIEDSTGIIQYNLSCYWALAGHVKLALTHLSNAFDINATLRDLVATEEDFDPIRTDPDFLALTTVIV